MLEIVGYASFLCASGVHGVVGFLLSGFLLWGIDRNVVDVSNSSQEFVSASDLIFIKFLDDFDVQFL